MALPERLHSKVVVEKSPPTPLCKRGEYPDRPIEASPLLQKGGQGGFGKLSTPSTPSGTTP